MFIYASLLVHHITAIHVTEWFTLLQKDAINTSTFKIETINPEAHKLKPAYNGLGGDCQWLATAMRLLVLSP